MQLRNGFMALNAGKCHCMCLGKNTRNETFFFKGLVMKTSKKHKILGVAIDNKLTFKSRIRIYIRKPHKKLVLYVGSQII